MHRIEFPNMTEISLISILVFFLSKIKRNDESIKDLNLLFSRVHVTLHLALSVRPSIHWLVSLSIGLSHFNFQNFSFFSQFRSFKGMISHTKSLHAIGVGLVFLDLAF